MRQTDLDAVKLDIDDVLTTSQAGCPEEFGRYGSYVLRLTWHSAGTDRALDG
ncbi:MAG: hypothetical protein P8N63_08585 [Pseudomonadales bacterium]|nr:hypothetical protein [Pseudomonadales bacterium]